MGKQQTVAQTMAARALSKLVLWGLCGEDAREKGMQDNSLRDVIGEGPTGQPGDGMLCAGIVLVLDHEDVGDLTTTPHVADRKVGVHGSGVVTVTIDGEMTDDDRFTAALARLDQLGEDSALRAGITDASLQLVGVPDFKGDAVSFDVVGTVYVAVSLPGNGSDTGDASKVVRQKPRDSGGRTGRPAGQQLGGYSAAA